MALSVLMNADAFADVKRTPSRRERIWQRCENGDRLRDLAQEFGISPQRNWKIAAEK